MKPTIPLDDPRLTAYALGDLSNEEDRLLIESALEDTPELQAFVDDIRDLGTTLREEFQTETLPEPVPGISIARKRSSWRYAVPLGLAACLALLLTWLPQRFSPTPETHQTVAPQELSGSIEGDSALPVASPQPVVAAESNNLSRLVMNDGNKPEPDPLALTAHDSEKEQPVFVSGFVSPDPQSSVTTSPHTRGDASNPNLSSLIAAIEESDASGLSELASVSKDNLSAGRTGSGSNALALAPTSASPARSPSAPAALAELNKKALVQDTSERGAGEERASFIASVSGNDASMPVPTGEFGRSITELDHKHRLIQPHKPGAESYASTVDQAFRKIVNRGDERTTFSTDVDTASYSNIRRFLTSGRRPPRDAVRVEEMINYFHYDYPSPADEERPFSVNLEVNEAPWASGHRLLRIGLKARDVMVDKRPDSNLVFLIDVSGSMSPYNKLPLLKTVLQTMARGLTERDMVSIVVYAGESRVHLTPTPGNETSRLIASIDQLTSGGSTNGESGIQLAYELASKHRLANGVNRVLLATDGDFNVGTTNTNQLVTMAKRRAKEDQIFLTVLGLGEDNVKDDRMEQLADQVDGSYHYIDSEREGRKVLIDEMSATLVPMAKDVKVQVEFNPAKVASYRLIGYANRMLPNRDFADDTKDAGEMGAGHTVTAFYEIVPTGGLDIDETDSPLIYRPQAKKEAPAEAQPEVAPSDDLVTVRLRYKDPKSETSQLVETSLIDDGTRWAQASEDYRFAAAVAAFGMHLRSSPHCRATLEQILQWAEAACTRDEYGWRAEFLDLVRRAGALH